jgi:two-component system, LytTR family, response regulator
MYNNALTQTLDPLPEMARMLAKRPKIAIKAKGRIMFIDPAEIVAVEAQGNYVLVRRRGGSDLLRESMTAVAEKLAAFGFVRIHRSVIVNSAFVEEITTLSTGDNVVRMQGGMEFGVSRTCRKNLHSITPLWIGTNGFKAG